METLKIKAFAVHQRGKTLAGRLYFDVLSVSEK